jgi:hypothetical protein
MSHFDISEWIDFARGVLPADRRVPLERHLADGCRDCADLRALLERANRAAAADREWAVPPECVSAAEAIFAEKLRLQPSFLSRLAARLVYDSFGEWQVAGVRSGRPVTRQLAFEAGEYCLDLSLTGDAAQTSLLGQLIHKTAASAPPDGTPVLLIAGETVVGRTTTNEFGEFSLEYQPHRSLRLCFALEREGCQIEVSLKEVL